MGTRIYVGGLDTRITERDLEDEFIRFGTLRSVWVARKPPGFAFIEYEDVRDAEDAVRKLDGGLQGWRVEFSRKDRGPSGGRGGGGGRDDFRGGGDRGGGGGGGMRSEMKCYECGEMGHFARDCRARGGGGGGGGGGDRYGDRDRGGGGGDRYGDRDSGRRGRSRSPVTRRRSPSYDPKPRRSPSYEPRARSGSPPPRRSVSPRRSPSP